MSNASTEMNTYKWKDLPLTPTIAAHHILDFLRSETRPFKRSDISQTALERHTASGGQRPVGDLEAVIKRALASLSEDNQILNAAPGFYRSVPTTQVLSDLTDENPEHGASGLSAEIHDNTVYEIGNQFQLKAETTIGEGPESVYVYFSQSDRRLAELESRSYWPCKIGYTVGDVSNRILQQGINRLLKNSLVSRVGS